MKCLLTSKVWEVQCHIVSQRGTKAILRCFCNTRNCCCLVEAPLMTAWASLALEVLYTSWSINVSAAFRHGWESIVWIFKSSFVRKFQKTEYTLSLQTCKKKKWVACVRLFQKDTFPELLGPLERPALFEVTLPRFYSFRPSSPKWTQLLCDAGNWSTSSAEWHNNKVPSVHFHLFVQKPKRNELKLSERAAGEDQTTEQQQNESRFAWNAIGCNWRHKVAMQRTRTFLSPQKIQPQLIIVLVVGLDNNNRQKISGDVMVSQRHNLSIHRNPQNPTASNLADLSETFLFFLKF